LRLCPYEMCHPVDSYQCCRKSVSSTVWEEDGGDSKLVLITDIGLQTLRFSYVRN